MKGSNFPNLFIHLFTYLKFIIISFLVSRGRKFSRLPPSDRNTRMLALVSSPFSTFSHSPFSLARVSVSYS